MSDYGAARDQTRDEARAKSLGCPYCSGEGMCEVFDPKYDGRSVVLRDVVSWGEVKRQLYPMVVAAHCICPLGRWVRSKTLREAIPHIPDLVEVLAGRSRWQAELPGYGVPCEPGAWDRSLPGGVVRVKDGRPA